jgi:hypothetical protein
VQARRVLTDGQRARVTAANFPNGCDACIYRSEAHACRGAHPIRVAFPPAVPPTRLTSLEHKYFS